MHLMRPLYFVFTPRVKWLGREADHSPPYSVKGKNVWSYTSTPPVHLAVWCKICVFMVWCLLKHRDNFTLILKYIFHLLLMVSVKWTSHLLH